MFCFDRIRIIRRHFRQRFVFLSTDSGLNWINADSGISSKSINTLVGLGIYLFAGTDNGSIHSAREGKTGYQPTWKHVNAGLVNKNVQTLIVHDNLLYAGTNGGGIFFSGNNGKNWIPINEGLVSMNIFSLASSKGRLYAGTTGAGVFQFSDSSKSWRAVNNGLPDNAVVYSFASLDSNLYVGIQGGVFVTSNNGTNWRFSGLKNKNAQSFAVSGKLIYSGTYGTGVFQYGTNKNDWMDFNSELSNLYINSLFLFKDDLFAGSDGEGVYSYHLPPR